MLGLVEAVAQFNITNGYTHTTGIDYHHEAFSNEQGKKGCFGKGCKVAMGYDLVGDDYKPHGPDSTPKPDSDPFDSCGKRSTGHGTHVAGIIAGNSTLIHGVAPDVTLGMWKVYGCYPTTSEDVVVKAMMDAYHKGVDIISVSIGSNNGWSESPMSAATQRITEKGVPVVIAAGNEGLNGAYTVLAPAKDATLVGSFDNNNFYTNYFIDQNNTFYPYHPSQRGGAMPNGTIAAGDVHLGSDHDACDPNQVNKKVKGHIALAKEGGCSLDTKLINLHEAGATGVIVYTDDDIEIYDGVKFTTAAANNTNTPLVTTFNRVGVKLVNDLAKGKNVTIHFGKAGIMPYPTGNTVSSFSGVGASYENDLKPDIAGIGGSVFSAVPVDMGNYGVMSGTSMAAPYLAGSIALYLEAHGKTTPRFINEQLQVYGYKAPHSFDEGDVDTPLRQGGGLLQLYDAIQQTVHASPSHLSFNDTANQIKSHTITVTNHDDTSTASFTVLNNVSVALHPFNNSDPGYPFLEPARYSNDSVSLRFSKKQFKLAPGKSVNITVSPVIPSTLEMYTMYGGYVQFKSDHPDKHKDLAVPYMGVIGNLHELKVFG
ncbi:subtilisin-like serine protease pr1c [Lichtheimia corymbifera JMRC:FSU:9682]|nr:subtilisin-like serine protease pr1c [Lichtheimia corymbifera JMRC:FSU:9682]